MQDRSYAIILFLVLGICVLGLYVAVSGFLNNAPQDLAARPITVAATSTLLVVTVNAPTAVPTVETTPSDSTQGGVAQHTPMGAFVPVTATLSTTIPDGIPTTRPLPPATATLVAQPCGGFRFCPGFAPPDMRTEIGGNPCPRNYVIGRIVDAAGRGLANMSIRFRIPSGEISDFISKDAKDELGKYDIPAFSASPLTGTIWLLDQGGTRVSPDFAVTVPQTYSGSGNCPTRVDFRAQR